MRGGKEKLWPFEEALARLLDSITWNLGTEPVLVMEALGRVLREEVKARFNIPPFDKSAMDGYAVRAADTRGARDESPAVLKVMEDVPAGKAPQKRILVGQASRIMTGAPLPSGADAVVMVEVTERDNAAKAVRIFKGVEPGENVGMAGEDVKKGEVVLRSGLRIGPADMGMIAALGKTKVKVAKRPRVAVISTGDEVQEPGRPLRKGRIYDANGYSLTGLARLRGCEAKFLGIAQDTPVEVAKKIKAAKGADLVLLTGGVSVGDYDFVTGLLRAAGISELFYKVNTQPGKPLFAGLKGRQLFLGLPGNPVSCLVCFELYGRPALDKMTGKELMGMPRGKAVLDTDLRIKPGRRKFLRAAIKGTGPEIRVAPHRNQKSGVLRSMVEADAFIDVPGETAELKAGTIVDIWWLWEDRIWRS